MPDDKTKAAQEAAQAANVIRSSTVVSQKDCSTNLEFAKQLVLVYGWKVFPAWEIANTTPDGVYHPKGKNPRNGAGGHLKATIDLAQLETWWKRWPNAYIGLPCTPNNFFAVDIDVHEGVNGYEAWEDFLADAPGVKFGATQYTPSGGQHYLFALPPDIEIKQIKPAPGIDLRSNGYICTGIAKTGYVWIQLPTVPLDFPQAPANFLDAVRNYKPPAKSEPQLTPGGHVARGPENSGDYWLSKALNTAQPGNRNNTGFWLACQLRDNSVPDPVDIMREYARKAPAGEHEYTEAEAITSLRQAMTTSKRPPAKSTQAGKISPQAANISTPPTFTPPEPEAPPLEDTFTEPPQARPRFVIHTMADALKPYIPEPMLVDGLIEPGMVGVFYGDGGTGKTYSIMNLAVCVAAGCPWLGMKTTQANVLFIDQDVGEKSTTIRFGRVGRGLEVKPDLPLYHGFGDYEIDKKQDRDEIIRLIERLKIGLVVFDALEDLSIAIVEKDPTEMMKVLRPIRWINEQTKAASIIIHHANRAGNYRGASSIKGKVDLLVKITKDANIISFTSDKVREGGALSFSARASFPDREDPEGIFTLTRCNTITSYSPSENSVLECLKEHDFITVELVSTEKNITDTTARKAINTLEKRLVIVRINPEERNKAGKYAYPNQA